MDQVNEGAWSSVAELLHEIGRVPVDESALANSDRSYDHRLVAHGLLREAAQLAVLAAGLTLEDDEAWDRDEAILVGHLVRMSKLLRWLLEELGRDRADLFFVALRMTGECIINLRYLLRYQSMALSSSYVHQSLQTDLALEDTIRANIESRDGDTWPIEHRMLDSIERDRTRAGVKRSDIPEKRIRNFGGKNLYEKAEAMELGGVYQAVFGGPSRMVHGGWKDLTMHHLEAVDDGRFQPRLETPSPSIQPVYAIGVLTCEALADYFRHFEHPELRPVLDRVDEVYERLVAANKLHEGLISGRQGGK